MSLLIIRAEEIRELLSMVDCIEVMDQAMRAFSAGEVSIPPRTIAPLADERSFFILMPGEMQSPSMYGAKVVSQHPDNPAMGRPACAVVPQAINSGQAALSLGCCGARAYLDSPAHRAFAVVAVTTGLLLAGSLLT